MRARDIAEDYPTVGPDDDAMQTAQLLAQRRLGAIVVVDHSGKPVAVLPGSQVLNFVIPQYVQDDPNLARAYDEKSADEFTAKLSGRRVREVLPPRELRDVEIVDVDATVVEVAAVMARMHSPVVAVLDHGEMVGVVTVDSLLRHVLPAA